MSSLPATLPKTRSRPPEDEIRQFLTFRLGDETYAVGIAKVREIVEFQSLTEIPLMPSFLRGVTNLRGAVIPVVDLLARFGKGNLSPGRRSCVVVVEVEHDDAAHPLGILVDAVNEVLPVENSRIEARPSFGTRIRPDFVEALLNLGDRFVVAIDVQQALSIEEMGQIAARWTDGPPDHDRRESLRIDSTHPEDPRNRIPNP